MPIFGGTFCDWVTVDAMSSRKSAVMQVSQLFISWSNTPSALATGLLKLLSPKLFISVVSVGEIEQGLENLRTSNLGFVQVLGQELEGLLNSYSDLGEFVLAPRR